MDLLMVFYRWRLMLGVCDKMLLSLGLDFQAQVCRLMRLNQHGFSKPDQSVWQQKIFETEHFLEFWTDILKNINDYRF